MTNGRMKLVTLAAIALLLVGLTACSSDDDSGSEDAGGEITEATVTTTATDDGPFEPTDEQCAALDTVPEDQAELDARVALFPEDLQDDVQEYTESIIAYITSADPETGEPNAPEPAPSEDLASVLTTCASLVDDGAGDGESGTGTGTGTEQALVTYESMDLVDGIATISLTATCADGSFPEDVTMAFGDPAEQLGAFDRGDGEFAISVEVDPDATEEELVDELGLAPEDLSTTFTATCA